MKNTNSDKTFNIALAGIIAAIYIVLGFLTSVVGLSFGPIQFRVSEALYLVFLDCPAMIPGMVIGCAVTNLFSPYGMIDVLVGSIATLLSAFCAWKARNVKFKNVPWLSMLAPVLINALIIGAEIALVQTSGKATFVVFITMAAQVAVGELVSVALGYFIKLNSNKLKRGNSL